MFPIVPYVLWIFLPVYRYTPSIQSRPYMDIKSWPQISHELAGLVVLVHVLHLLRRGHWSTIFMERIES